MSNIKNDKEAAKNFAAKFRKNASGSFGSQGADSLGGNAKADRRSSGTSIRRNGNRGS